MYQFSYADILADDADDARAREHQLLDKAIALLNHAADAAPQSPEVTRALDFTTQLWAYLIQDLAHPGNALPDQLKADLMSVGLGIMGECSRIMSGQSRDIAAVADICGIIRDGLN